MSNRTGKNRTGSTAARFFTGIAPAIRAGWRRTPLWARSLDDLAADQSRTLLCNPSTLWPGQEARGEELLDNYFTFVGETHGLNQGPDTWRPAGTTKAWCRALNRFDWIADLRATSGNDGKQAAASAVMGWIASNRGFSTEVWDVDVTAQRLTNWLIHLNFLTASQDPLFFRAVIEQVARQARFLMKLSKRLPKNASRFTVAKALIAAGVALDDFDEARFLGLKLLETTLEVQALADGGHVSRNPDDLVLMLRELIEIRTFLFEGGREQPERLNQRILASASAVKALLHGDQKFTHMNAVPAPRAGAIERLLQRAGEVETPRVLPNMGFLRLNNRRGLLMVDCAGPPVPPYDNRAHAGASSFEYAIGQQRVIVNCGTPINGDAFGHSQRFTAAHSTVNIGDRHSSDLIIDEKRGPLGFGQRRTRVTAHHDNYDSFDLIQIEQDGYEAVGGGRHRRTLQLAADGEQLDGEDHIYGCSVDPIDIRFHLHPDVKPRNDGNSVFLRLPQGRGWVFSVDGGNIRLSPSIYFEGDRHWQSNQIIVRAALTGDSATVRWSLAREGRAARAQLSQPPSRNT